MTRKEHIEHMESVCLLMGVYTHEGVTITKVPEGWRVSSDNPDYVPMTWPELDMAITDLLSLTELLDPRIEPADLN